jgi:hypothetical protein
MFDLVWILIFFLLNCHNYRLVIAVCYNLAHEESVWFEKVQFVKLVLVGSKPQYR